MHWSPRNRGLIDELARTMGVGGGVRITCVADQPQAVAAAPIEREDVEVRALAIDPRLGTDELAERLRSEVEIAEARAVIVLPRGDVDEPDSVSRLTCAAIRRACGDRVGPNVLVEVEDPEAAFEFVGLGVATVFYSGHLRAALLGQACVDLGVFQFILGLLRGRHRVRTIAVPEALRTQSFAEAALALETDDDGRPMTVIGVAKPPLPGVGGQANVVVNPGPATPLGDALGLLVLVTGALLLMLTLLLPTSARAGEPLRFGAGSKGGGFATTGEAIAGALAETKADFELEVAYTKGSCDNIRKLAGGEVDAALVQYDVAAEAFAAAAAAREAGAGDDDGEDGEGAKSGWMCELTAAELEGVELQLVAAIDDAAVHVIVRRPVRLDDFTIVGDRPIFVGQRGSGSMETSKVILGAAGLTLDDVNSLDIKNKAAMAAMQRGELLMMLRTTEIGDPAIAKLIATGMADVNALPAGVIERLIDGFPYYRVCQIDAHSYPGLDFVIPTVCVSTVVLTAKRDGEPVLDDDRVVALIDALRWLSDHPTEDLPPIDVHWRGFAEREPVPLHDGATWVERRDFVIDWTLIGAGLLAVLGLLALLRRFLRRKGLLGNPLTGNLEGQLSNPLVPFVGFLLIVGAATLVVWNLEHDSNARVRTLNDSFWEMNMFATGNFDSESLKTSTARVIGAAATIAGLGLLAWFTAALTSILSRDQMRLFRRMRNHIVILNFREEMIQLIRVLRSPGPLRQRSIHVVVSDALPPRVRQQLTRVRGLTIYQQNPEVPEDLVDLRLPRAARVIVLQGGYHPLRIARAVHHACVRLDPQARAETMKRAELGLSPSVQSPTLAGDEGEGRAAVPVTLIEAGVGDSEDLFAPFSRWLVPVPARALADAWLANACLDPIFGDFFNDIVTFRDGNSELYTVEVPAGLHGQTWRDIRRLLYTAQSRAGIVPIGLYRGHRGKLAYAQDDVEDSSPQAELARRLLINPALDLQVGPGDRLLAFAEDEADLRKVLKLRRR